MDGGAWWAAVHGVAKSRTRLSDFIHFSLSCIGEGNGNPLQCSCLERIPGTGEPGGLPSMGLHRVGHDWSDLAAAAAVAGLRMGLILDIYYLQLNGSWHLLVSFVYSSAVLLALPPLWASSFPSVKWRLWILIYPVHEGRDILKEKTIKSWRISQLYE